jgi:hypothetical protein
MAQPRDQVREVVWAGMAVGPIGNRSLEVLRQLVRVHFWYVFLFPLFPIRNRTNVLLRSEIDKLKAQLVDMATETTSS